MGILHVDGHRALDRKQEFMRNLAVNTIAAFAILALAGAAPFVLPGQVPTAGASATSATPTASQVVIMGEPLHVGPCVPSHAGVGTGVHQPSRRPSVLDAR